LTEEAQKVLRGRDVVFDYLRDLGVPYLFGVPGTNEIPLIDGTDELSNCVKYVPCLHENIAVGAAMGYARVSGKPGVVELHVTPGAAHGIGNLFNAYKAHIPVVILCAQQHNQLLVQEPLLASDLVQVARQYTKWSYEVRFADELPLVLQRAFKEALSPPMAPVFLSIPWDFTLAPMPEHWKKTRENRSGRGLVTHVGRHFVGDLTVVDKAATMLAEAKNPVFVVGDGVGAAKAWRDIQRLAELVGAPVWSEALQSYMNFPNGKDQYRGKGELPQTQREMRAAFKNCDAAFLCGHNAQAQVLIFVYDRGSMIPDDVPVIYLHDDAWQIGKNGYGDAAILGDIGATLPALYDKVVAANPDTAAAEKRNVALKEAHKTHRAAIDAVVLEQQQKPPDGLPDGNDIALAISHLQKGLTARPILCNEAVSDSGAFQEHIEFEEPSSYFFGVGGSLGYSMPASVGMKLAADKKHTVINVVGDGSALFYPHTWWTAAQLKVPILFIITNNREYKTLMIGLKILTQIYKWTPSGKADYLLLDKHPTSFVELAKAFGIVDGARVGKRADLAGALRTALEVVTRAEDPRSYVLEILTDPTLPKGLDKLTFSRVPALSDTEDDTYDQPDAEPGYFGPA
jgi:benzoylformate decarboxylase